MSRHVACTIGLFLVCLMAEARAGTITTGEIIERTADATFACMRFSPVGLCFWLDCSLFGCRVETTLKVGHYNPDVVVSSFNELGKNPWVEMQTVLGRAEATAAKGILGRLAGLVIGSAGNRTEGSYGNQDHKNLIFRETDVIGHPADLLSGAFPLTLCESQAKAFTPYFLSGLDAWSWRLGVTELLYPASVTPGLREVGHWPTNTWGAVFPRTGWSIQAEEPKAAALTAQRAGDIVTRAKQPHVYKPLSGPRTRKQRVWSPGPLVETDASTGTWQMLLPKTDADCAVFGSNDLTSPAGWSGGRVDAAGDYVWNLWRPYQCCERDGQWFLFDINWREYP